jgi:AraC-like DNA-binding protein
VSHYWTLDGEPSVGKPFIHRTLANFYSELIFHYGGRFSEIAKNGSIENTFVGGLHGQTDLVRRFTYTQPCGIFGVMLQPYAIPVLFDIPSTSVKNQLIDFHDLIGKQGSTITKMMLNAKSNVERIQIANNFLESKLKEVKRPEIPFAVQKIYDLKGMVNVKWLSHQACLCQRQFERKFKEQVGFSAKSFMNIVRFKSLISTYGQSLTSTYSQSGKNLTEIACDFGYYDQSHFIKEFKAFSGYTPHSYFSGDASEVFYAP